GDPVRELLGRVHGQRVAVGRVPAPLRGPGDEAEGIHQRGLAGPAVTEHGDVADAFRRVFLNRWHAGSSGSLVARGPWPPRGRACSPAPRTPRATLGPRRRWGAAMRDRTRTEAFTGWASDL